MLCNNLNKHVKQQYERIKWDIQNGKKYFSVSHISLDTNSQVAFTSPLLYSFKLQSYTHICLSKSSTAFLI